MVCVLEKARALDTSKRTSMNPGCLVVLGNTLRLDIFHKLVAVLYGHTLGPSNMTVTSTLVVSQPDS